MDHFHNKGEELYNALNSLSYQIFNCDFDKLIRTEQAELINFILRYQEEKDLYQILLQEDHEGQKDGEEKTLETLRQEIDKIDKKMTKLFERRMNVVLEIIAYKKRNHMYILDPERELTVIDRNLKYLKNLNFEPYLVEFLKKIMEISRHIQSDNE